MYFKTRSIPDVAIKILHSLNPSGRTMSVGLTQPLTEMSLFVFLPLQPIVIVFFTSGLYPPRFFEVS